MTQEREATIEAIVRETLAERFTDAEFVFDPIRVVPAVDEWAPTPAAMSTSKFSSSSMATGKTLTPAGHQP